MRFKYVLELSKEIQEKIEAALIEAGIEGEDLERGMASKVVDLEDTINVKEIIK